MTSKYRKTTTNKTQTTKTTMTNKSRIQQTKYKLQKQQTMTSQQ